MGDWFEKWIVFIICSIKAKDAIFAQITLSGPYSIIFFGLAKGNEGSQWSTWKIRIEHSVVRIRRSRRRWPMIRSNPMVLLTLNSRGNAEPRNPHSIRHKPAPKDRSLGLVLLRGRRIHGNVAPPWKTGLKGPPLSKSRTLAYQHGRVAVPSHKPHGIRVSLRRLIVNQTWVLERVKRKPKIFVGVILKIHGGSHSRRGSRKEGYGVGVNLRRNKSRMRMVFWVLTELSLKLKIVARGLCFFSDSHFRGFLRFWVPWRKLGELVNGGFGLLDEPIHGLAGSVIPKTVLNVVELNGCVGWESNPSVSRTLCSVNLTVTIFSTCGSNNVASLDLNNLSSCALHAHQTCFFFFFFLLPDVLGNYAFYMGFWFWFWASWCKILKMIVYAQVLFLLMIPTEIQIPIISLSLSLCLRILISSRFSSVLACLIFSSDHCWSQKTKTCHCNLSYSLPLTPNKPISAYKQKLITQCSFSCFMHNWLLYHVLMYPYPFLSTQRVNRQSKAVNSPRNIEAGFWFSTSTESYLEGVKTQTTKGHWTLGFNFELWWYHMGEKKLLRERIKMCVWKEVEHGEGLRGKIVPFGPIRPTSCSCKAWQIMVRHRLIKHLLICSFF